MGIQLDAARASADAQLSNTASSGATVAVAAQSPAPQYHRGITSGSEYLADALRVGQVISEPARGTERDRIEGEPPRSPDAVDKTEGAPERQRIIQKPGADRPTAVDSPRPAEPDQPARGGFLRNVASRVGGFFRNLGTPRNMRKAGTAVGIAGVGYAGVKAASMFGQTGLITTAPMLGVLGIGVAAVGAGLLIRHLANRREAAAGGENEPSPATTPDPAPGGGGSPGQVVEPIREDAAPAPRTPATDAAAAAPGGRVYREVIRQTPDGQSVIVLEEVRQEPRKEVREEEKPAEKNENEEEPAIARGLRALGAVGVVGGVGWAISMSLGGAAGSALAVPLGIAAGSALVATVAAQAVGGLWNRFVNN